MKVKNVLGFDGEKIHWYGFDLVKGILIVFVFMGHILPGDVRDTFSRYAIYSFHMPLFIGISGFLLNIEKIDMRFPKLFTKYWKRLVLPWIIAVIFFYIATHEGRYTLFGIIQSFCYPYYHLWYVLGFISYLLMTCFLWTVLKKTKYRWIWVFVISVVISVVSKWDLLIDLFSKANIIIIYERIQNDFRMYNFIFFILGTFCRYTYEHNERLLTDKFAECLRVLMGLSIIMVVILFSFNYPNMEKIMYYVMNIPILLVVFFDCVNSSLPRSRIFEFLGKYSLPIYLYHVLCKLAAMHFFAEGSERYYLVSVLTFVIGCILVYYLRNNRFINKVIFGSTFYNGENMTAL